MFFPPDKCFGEQALGIPVLCYFMSFWKPLLNLECSLWPALEQHVMDSMCSRKVCWVVRYINEWMEPYWRHIRSLMTSLPQKAVMSDRGSLGCPVHIYRKLDLKSNGAFFFFFLATELGGIVLEAKHRWSLWVRFGIWKICSAKKEAKTRTIFRNSNTMLWYSAFGFCLNYLLNCWFPHVATILLRWC